MNYYRQQSKNISKTWMLMLVFAGLVIGVGYIFAAVLNMPQILYLAFGLSIITNVGAYWFSDKLVLSMTNAKPASREQYFDVYTITENLAITAGLPMPKLYVVDDPAPNAFATGRNKHHAVVAVTTGLIDTLNKSELEGVIAHELAHVNNKDMLISTIAVVLVGVLAMMVQTGVRVFAFGGGGNDRAKGPIMLVGIVLALLAPLLGTLMRLAVSRKREYLADATGALYTRYPEGLASALEKISGYAGPMKSANTATAHLFISDPFAFKAKVLGGKVSKLFATHPPAAERIAALRAMK